MTTAATRTRATCSGCTTTWTGLSTAHCPSCHLPPGSPSGFDEHRAAGRCRTQLELTGLGYRRNDRGIWRKPLDPTRTPAWYGTAEPGRVAAP